MCYSSYKQANPVKKHRLKKIPFPITPEKTGKTRHLLPQLWVGRDLEISWSMEHVMVGMRIVPQGFVFWKLSPQSRGNVKKY